MATPAYNDANFRAQFPAFADPVKYPLATLSGYWTTASLYINPANVCGWTTAQLQRAIDLMAAHLTQQATLLAAGIPSVILTGSTQGTVTVSMQPPPTPSAFGWWLSTSPYGAELRALLGMRANVGFYVGGQAPRGGFRNGWGNFW